MLQQSTRLHMAPLNLIHPFDNEIVK